MDNEQFKKLLDSLESVKSRQDAVVCYERALSSITGTTTVNVDSGSILDNVASGLYPITDGTTSVFNPHPIGKPKHGFLDPHYKKPIPAIPLDLGAQFRNSLLPFIGTSIPMPTLKRTSDMSLGEEHDLKAEQLSKIAAFLRAALFTKLKSSRMFGQGCNWEEVLAEGWRTGNNAVEFIRVDSDGTRDFDVRFVPFDSLFLSRSGRFLCVVREVFYGDDDRSEYTFRENDWTGVESFEDSKEFYEVWDLQERKVYYKDREGFDVKKSKDWASGQDFPPIVVNQSGEIDCNGVYAKGLEEAMLRSWEESIYHLSILSSKLKQSEKTKFIVPNAMSDDEEFLMQLEDASLNYAAYAQMGDPESFDIRKSMIPYSPINNSQEAVTGLGLFLDKLTPMNQSQPQLSRGDAPANSAYMKAGTAAKVNEVRDNKVSVIQRSAAEFMERIYKVMLDFFSYNSDLDIITYMLGSSEELLKELNNDLDVSVSIKDISAPSEAEKAQKAQMFVQVGEPLVRSIQAASMLYSGAGYTFDVQAFLSATFEDLLGISPAKFIKKQNIADEYGNLKQRPEQQIPGQPQQMPSEVKAMGLDNLYATLEQLGRDDIMAALSELGEPLVQEISDVFSAISNDAIKATFIRDLGDSLDAADAQGEVVDLLNTWKRKLQGGN